MKYNVCLVALLLLTAAAATAGPVRVLHNVRLDAAEEHGTTATALAWQDGRILALGDAAEIARDHPAAERIDGGGRRVIPGLIDAHAHLFNLGYSLLNVDLRGTTSKAQIVERLEAFARELPAEAWLLGRGWDQNRWDESAFPTAADLDQAFPERPVWLERIDGHAGWANSAALRALAADDHARLMDPDWQPDGGRVVRENGRPTGVFIDTAAALVDRVVPPPGSALRERALTRALAEAVRLGLTGVHDMGVSLQDMQVMRRLADRGELPLRITAYADGDRAALDALCAFGAYRHAGGRLRMAGVKLYADGALGSRGAALLAPYADDPAHTGLLVTAPDELRAALRKASDCGLQVAAHAIGDRANRIVLDLFAEFPASARAQRWRIEHAQVVSLDDIPRFATLGVLASMQPTHATSDMPWAGLRVGTERLAGAYAWRRLLDAGVGLPLGSDFPVEEVNPMLGLHAAVTRQDLAGQPPGGWLAEQRLDRREALHGFTRAAAEAGHAETEVGALAVGLRADFVVLEDDYFEVSDARIAEIRVHSTWVDGQPVYRRTATP